MKKDTQEYRTRLKEMTAVLRKYGGIRGLTPQKLRKFRRTGSYLCKAGTDSVNQVRHDSKEVL